MSSNPRVMSSNPQVTSSNPQVMSLNPQIRSLNPQVTSSIPWIIKSMKTQVNSLKSSSCPKIISRKLFGSLWGNSVSGDNLLFYVSTTPWVRLHNFERKHLNSPEKLLPCPDDFVESCFFCCFYFKKTKCDRFFFHLFYAKLCTVPLNYYCQAL